MKFSTSNERLSKCSESSCISRLVSESPPFESRASESRIPFRLMSLSISKLESASGDPGELTSLVSPVLETVGTL